MRAMGSKDKLDDVWEMRDFPVLVEVARRIDAGERLPSIEEVANSIGMEITTAQLAAAALRRVGLLELGGPAEFDAWFTDISPEAYLLTGLHPRGEDAILALLDALKQAETAVDDTDDKAFLRRAGSAIGSVSQNVMANVLAAYIRQQTGV